MVIAYAVYLETPGRGYAANQGQLPLVPGWGPLILEVQGTLNPATAGLGFVNLSEILQKSTTWVEASCL